MHTGMHIFKLYAIIFLSTVPPVDGSKVIRATFGSRSRGLGQLHSGPQNRPDDIIHGQPTAKKKPVRPR